MKKMRHDRNCFGSLLGCPSQYKTKTFLSAKDIRPSIDEAFLEELTTRCAMIFKRLNAAVHQGINQDDIDEFITNLFPDVRKLVELSSTQNVKEPIYLRSPDAIPTAERT